MNRKIIIGLVVLSMFLVFAGCVGKEEAKKPVAEEKPKFKTVEPGKLLVGVDATYPPFEYIENNEYKGFDIDLMREIAKRLGIEVEFVNQAWEGIIPALKSHKFDCICSAMTITKERAKQIDFSDPYFEAGQVIVVRKDSTIADAKDLEGKKVGVQLGTTGEYAARDLAKNYTFEIKTYDTTPDAFLDLKNGNIDAVICDNTVAEPLVKNNPDTYKIVGEKLTVEYYGIAVAKDNPELLAAINKALKEVKEDGTYDKIYGKWFGKS